MGRGATWGGLNSAALARKWICRTPHIPLPPFRVVQSRLLSTVLLLITGERDPGHGSVASNAETALASQRPHRGA